MTNSIKKISHKQCSNFSNFIFVLDVLKKPTVSTLKMFKQDFKKSNDRILLATGLIKA